MISRRPMLYAGVCIACTSPSVFAQIFPNPSRPAPKRPVAPACGFDRQDFLKLVPGPRNHRSGIRELDDNLRRELDLLEKLFSVEPEFTFVDGTARSGAFTGPTPDNKTLIVFDVQLVRNEMAVHPGTWQSSIIGILAHEFAHALQYQAIVEESRLWETHADFLSGWYMGTKVLMGLSRLNIDVFADALFQRGSLTGFFDERGYGPPEARVASMRAGANTAKKDFEPGKLPSIRFAASEGYDYARSIVK